MSTLRCLYSCAICGLDDVGCDVAERGPAEDVAHWMRAVAIVALSRDHQRRSPRCTATNFAKVMIPLTGAARVGDVPRH